MENQNVSDFNESQLEIYEKYKSDPVRLKFINRIEEIKNATPIILSNGHIFPSPDMIRKDENIAALMKSLHEYDIKTYPELF